MTTTTRTDWHEVAALEDAQRVAWITEHGRNADESTRRDWMRDFIDGTLALEDVALRSKMMHSLLASMLTMEDAEARSYSADLQWVLDHAKGATAFAAIQCLHTGARDLTVEDTMRLG